MTELSWKYVKPLLKTDAVDNFEKENNIFLPQDLKQCIMLNNVGRPSLNVFDTGVSKDRVFKTLLSFNEQDTENIFTFFPVIHSQKMGSYRLPATPAVIFYV